MIDQQTNSRCEFIKDGGDFCKARRLSGSRFCFFHDPARSNERKAASQKGGSRHRMASLPRETAEFEVKKAEDVVKLLSLTVNQVRRGEIDPKVANSVGYLSGIILRAREQGDIEDRLQQIEQIVQKGRPENVAGVIPQTH